MPEPDTTSPAHNSPAGDTPACRYNAALANEIESRWQLQWETEGVFIAPNPGEPGFDASRPKKYILDMFPYPSGVGLHVGHPLGYIATDILARYHRMTGHNVLHTMGFDAFGLPAEQYAVQTGQHPRITTYSNIATMRAQLRRLGLGHDPKRSVSTTDPDFYKWTQWIFLQIYNSWYDASANRARPIADLEAQFASASRPTSSGKAWAALSPVERRRELDKHRLAYVDEVPVNWCPMLGTVLANEEVTADGKSERGNYPVYRRPLKQWLMRITAYAERLLADLDPLDWPEPIKLMQRNWIGRSEGAFIDFAASNRRIRVFTTRPDTLFGATYLVLSPEHPLVEWLVTDKYGPSVPASWLTHFPGAPELAARAASPREFVEAYRAFAKSRTDVERQEAKEKTGAFTGAYAINPANNTRIPIFIADYVLMGYGTGAIMAVPAHDERDHEFAARFGLPTPVVVRPATGDQPEGCFSDAGVAVNSAGPEVSIDGLPTAEAKRVISEWLARSGWGKPTVNYKLRDWLFSRQRYWGEPFPIVYDDAGDAHALPESMLPVLLPELDNFRPESSSDPDAPPRPPLARAKDWVTITLDLGDGPRTYTRETNTMPNWAGSCWYYLRYLDPADSASFCAPPVERYWMAGGAPAPASRIGGVDLYVGGVEHAVLHLLYARFWHKILFDLGHVSTPEPFQRLFNQGYIQAAAFTDSRGVYVEASEVVERDGAFFHNNEPVTREYGKMGKSLKNAVTPGDICEEYGCDTLRLYEMAMGPLEASKPWNTRDIAGSYRFLQRVWRHLIDENTGVSRVTAIDAAPATRRLLHKTIIGVRRDMEALAFNTAISKLIEFNNHLGTLDTVPIEAARPLILMLAPLAPHIAEELWRRVVAAHDPAMARTTILFEPYPVGDPALAADDTIEIPVQINGKLRAKISVPAGSDPKTIEAAALADDRVREVIGTSTIKKVVVVPGRMVNLVIG